MNFTAMAGTRVCFGYRWVAETTTIALMDVSPREEPESNTGLPAMYIKTRQAKVPIEVDGFPGAILCLYGLGNLTRLTLNKIQNRLGFAFRAGGPSPEIQVAIHLETRHCLGSTIIGRKGWDPPHAPRSSFSDRNVRRLLVNLAGFCLPIRGGLTYSKREPLGWPPLSVCLLVIPTGVICGEHDPTATF